MVSDLPSLLFAQLCDPAPSVPQTEDKEPWRVMIWALRTALKVSMIFQVLTHTIGPVWQPKLVIQVSRDGHRVDLGPFFVIWVTWQVMCN